MLLMDPGWKLSVFSQFIAFSGDQLDPAQIIYGDLVEAFEVPDGK